MLKFKDCAPLSGLDQNMLDCVDICNIVLGKQGVDCTIISTEGPGIDLQTWHIHDVEAAAKNLRRALGKGFDVTVEEDHIHVEHKAKVAGRKKSGRKDKK